MTIKINLTAPELRVAANVAVERRIDSIRKGLNSQKHVDGHSWNCWDGEINGAAAELAVAKLFDVHWNCGVGTFKAPDVGSFQVRSTTYPNGKLIFRPNDSESDLFILVICDTPVYNIVGYIKGRDAMECGRVDTKFGNKAWFVDQEFLRNIKDLIDER